MQLTVTVNVPKGEAGVTILQKVRELMQAGEASETEVALEAEPVAKVEGATKRKRRTKAELEAAEEKAGAADAGLSDEDLADEPEIDLGDEEPEEKPVSKLTLEKHIIPAFRAFAQKHSRIEAGKVLAKYKVNSVHDLPEAKYSEVMQRLEA